MIVKWIEPAHFGPFAVPHRIYIDPEVTVLTGANDTGKSAVLRAIRLLFTGEIVGEQDVNEERLGAFPRWQDDAEVGCTVCVEVTERSLSQQELTGQLKVGDEAVFFGRLTVSGPSFNGMHVIRKGQQVEAKFRIKNPPQVLTLPLAGDLREEVNLSALTVAESSLVRLGFGSGFNLDQYKGLRQGARSNRLSGAQERLNTRLREILPPNLYLEFRLHEAGGDPAGLTIALVDPLKNHVPLGSRGAGVRKLLALMGALLPLTEPTAPTIILFDEPENSLHPDAQHMLRRLLERVGQSPLAQVIYATHSPAMINTMRPGAIRVLRRQLDNGKPTTVVDNEAFGENFMRVRSSLGLTPADSLLYAPVTVVVEGSTEVRSLPMLLRKLQDGAVPGFEDAAEVLSQAHFLNGAGDSYEYMCRLAKSQNAKPVVFLDGDKPEALAKLREKHPEVPVVQLDAGQEFENLVPEEVYVAAAEKLLQDGTGTMNVDSFRQWLDRTKPKKNWMLSKRVERWLDDVFDRPLYKPMIMEQAVKDAPVEGITIAPLEKLLEAMRAALGQIAGPTGPSRTT